MTLEAGEGGLSDQAMIDLELFNDWFSIDPEHQHGDGVAHVHEGIDGHTWPDPLNAKTQAKAILEALLELLPDHEAELRSRYAALAADLEKLHQRLMTLGDRCRREIIYASHPAYNYLGRRYGWKLENLALDPGKMPSDEQMTGIRESLAEKAGRIILWESAPTAAIETRFRKDLGLTSIEFSPCELLGSAEREAGADHLKVMGNNLDNLARALGPEDRQAAPRLPVLDPASWANPPLVESSFHCGARNTEEHMPSDLPLAVVGAGAVGSILTGHLLKAGHDDLAVVDVPERIEQIRKHGIGFTNEDSVSVMPKHLFEDVRDLGGRNVRTVILATKVTHLDTVGPLLAEVHHPDMIVVSFQNGIGTENSLGKHIDPMRVARAIVNFAGVKDPETGHVSVSWFHPPNFIGPYQSQPLEPFEKIASAITEAGLETRAVPRTEMKRQAFFKTILNAALNAMCATTGLTMSEAMGMKQTRFLARQLLREGLSVATQMGYHYGEDVLDRCLTYLDLGGNHYPSMWMDLQNNRRTEIDYINGKLVKIGMMFGHLSVALNMFFCTMVMTQEIRAGTRAPEDVPPYLACDVRLCC